MNKPNILLVEDDESLGYILSEYLQMNGFVVIWKKEGISALEVFLEKRMDLCLLDIMMPKMDGFELAKNLKKQDVSIPIIFLTAKGLKIDKLKGFNIGADDFIVKPVDEEELIARIRAVLRRSKEKDQPLSLKFGKHLLKIDERTLHLFGKEKRLTEKETTLLKLLIKNQNRLLTREEAMKEVWGRNDYFNRRSMDVHLTHLRSILREDSSLQIVNVHGKGFIFKI